MVNKYGNSNITTNPFIHTFIELIQNDGPLPCQKSFCSAIITYAIWDESKQKLVFGKNKDIPNDIEIHTRSPRRPLMNVSKTPSFIAENVVGTSRVAISEKK